jgi:hypothetical protein
MNADDQAIQALQYLLDEGFIALGYIDGKPSVYLTTSVSEAQRAIKSMAKDSADWWKK